jgi:lipopolysaccharide transport system permease protein
VHLCPNRYLLLFPVVLLILQGIALGLGLIITSLTTKYKDLVNFFGVFVSLWMYATPIVYPLSYVTNPTLHKIMLLNPLTSLIETFKYGAYGAGEFSWSALGYSFVCMLVLVVIGVFMFNRKQKYFIDTI